MDSELAKRIVDSVPREMSQFRFSKRLQATIGIMLVLVAPHVLVGCGKAEEEPQPKSKPNSTARPAVPEKRQQEQGQSAEAFDVNTLRVQIDGYELRERYDYKNILGEDASLTAKPGHQLLLVRFSLANLGDKPSALLSTSLEVTDGKGARLPHTFLGMADDAIWTGGQHSGEILVADGGIATCACRFLSNDQVPFGLEWTMYPKRSLKLKLLFLIPKGVTEARLKVSESEH